MHEPGGPPTDLMLKVGCIASVMRNLSIEDGLVKNARVQVVSLHPNMIQLRLLQQGAIVPTDYVCNMPTFYLRNTNWTVKRCQFPLRLAYATTFNSCQGLVLDLTKPVFAHG